MTYKVSSFFEKRAKLGIQTFVVEGVQFELMALDEELITEIKSIDDYDMALELASNYGLSFKRQRVQDDENLSQDLEMLWQQEELLADADPSIREQVGEQVLIMSGLSAFISDLLEIKKEKQAVEDLELDGDTKSQEEMSEDINKLLDDQAHSA